MTKKLDIEDAQVEKIEPETQNEEQQTDETQKEESKVRWWVGSTSKITTTINGAPYEFVFPNTASLADLANYAGILPEIVKDIVKQRSEAVEAQKSAEEKEEIPPQADE